MVAPKVTEAASEVISAKKNVRLLECGFWPEQPAFRYDFKRVNGGMLVQDASGDSLDATLCLLQAAWAQREHAQGDALYGLPPGLDALEGWIVTAPVP